MPSGIPAERNDLEPSTTHIDQHLVEKRGRDALAPEPRRDLDVGNRKHVAIESIVDPARELTIEMELVATGIRIVVNRSRGHSSGLPLENSLEVVEQGGVDQLVVVVERLPDHAIDGLHR